MAHNSKSQATSLGHQLLDALRTQRYLNALATFVVLLALNAGGVLVASSFIKDDLSEWSYEHVAYNTLVCNTHSAQASGEFLIYDFHLVGATRLARLLCAHPELAQKYKLVRVRWQHESIENLRAIMDHYDMIVANASLMDSANIGSVQLFEPIARYKDYEAVFISHYPIDVLMPQNIAGKRIGLLDKRTSQSGYLIAREALSNAGVSFNDLNVSYYPSHKEVRQALLANEVDIIASYWNPEKDVDIFRDLHRKTLRVAEGYQWYLRRELVGTPIECAIHDTLKTAVRASSGTYFTNLEFLRECSSL